MQQKPLGVEAVLEKKRRYLIPCVYHFYADPPQIVRGQGVWLLDAHGKAYMDLYSGVSVSALGHCHPQVTEAICRQVRTLQHTTTIYLTEPIVKLAEALAKVLPGDIDRSFFCASGSEANEGAALLATLYTGRNRFLAFQNSLHGRTKLAMCLTGLSFWRTDPHPVAGISHVPVPHCSACVFGKSFGRCDFECVQAVERTIVASTSGKPAAMFVEPLQGNGGVIVPPDGYFQRLRQLLDKYEVLLIADEVQTGFGRTGKMFAMDHWDVEPDIITGGKALGGGTPIGFFSTSEQIADSYTRPGASTFGGNPVTATAGLSFLEVLGRDKLAAAAAKQGSELKERLATVAQKFQMIREVRGLGLMIGVEMDSFGGHDPAELTDQILERMKDAGFLLGKTGPARNVLTWMPPLIVEQSQLQDAADAFEKILSAI